MKGLMVLCAVLTCALAAFLILYVLAKGIPNLNWQLLTTKPSARWCCPCAGGAAPGAAHGRAYLRP